MQMSLFIWILHLMDLNKGRGDIPVLRRRRSSVVDKLCQAGCVSCSPLNGCLSCKPRLFFHLDLEGMRQRGSCLSSCPRGHYGMRSPNISTCARCVKECASCFNKSFCTRCHSGYFLFRGRCESSCPNGLTPNTAIRECTECPTGCHSCVTQNTCSRCMPDLYLHQGQCHHTCPEGFEQDSQFMICIPQVNCEVGEWGEWGPCVRRRGSVRPYGKREEMRAREILRMPTPHGDACAHISESRKCVVKKRQGQSRANDTSAGYLSSDSAVLEAPDTGSQDNDTGSLSR